ncbi:hypothetical protein [Aureispira anguillae]|uniref:Uncharacterized protein n=1 Tax=Aureispira anguillae TaxID=2864201 RepID=A0A915YI34_9BACT|nr:hypothetical protein [Aureispira anguillae]BDS13414.1 hypothetical protein AsAng_0041510 [Aureispira anguillae]
MIIINFTRPAIIAYQMKPKNETLRQEKLNYLTGNPPKEKIDTLPMENRPQKQDSLSIASLMVLLGVALLFVFVFFN